MNMAGISRATNHLPTPLPIPLSRCVMGAAHRLGFRDQHVLQLDVAVRHAVRVDVVQRLQAMARSDNSEQQLQ